MSFPVFFDTCALFGATTNDLILRLADRGAFRPLWSAEVLDELERTLATVIEAPAAARRVGAMREAFPDALVTGYEALTSSMPNDEGDRHVMAAAVKSDAAVIVTFNLRHFPPEELEPYDLLAVHPDDFLQDQVDLYPAVVLTELEDQASAYEDPPMTVNQLIASLGRELPQFATDVRRLLR